MAAFYITEEDLNRCNQCGSRADGPHDLYVHKRASHPVFIVSPEQQEAPEIDRDSAELIDELVDEPLTQTEAYELGIPFRRDGNGGFGRRSRQWLEKAGFEFSPVDVEQRIQVRTGIGRAYRMWPNMWPHLVKCETTIVQKIRYYVKRLERDRICASIWLLAALDIIPIEDLSVVEWHRTLMAPSWLDSEIRAIRSADLAIDQAQWDERSHIDHSEF